MPEEPSRPPVPTRRSLAAAFVLLALAFAIVRYPPWLRILGVQHALDADETPSFAARATSALVIYWWIFSAIALGLAVLAWLGKLGKRGWTSVAAVTLLSGAWIGYAWYSYQAALRRIQEGG
jgi:hypothetical protein